MGAKRGAMEEHRETQDSIMMVMMKEKKKRIHFFFFIVVLLIFFFYNKPENEPGTRKNAEEIKNVNEARDEEKKHHEVKKEYLKTGFFGEWFQSNWIQLGGGREYGAFHIDG